MLLTLFCVWNPKPKRHTNNKLEMQLLFHFVKTPRFELVGVWLSFVLLERKRKVQYSVFFFTTLTGRRPGLYLSQELKT